MITISELSSAVKNRVVTLFDRDAFNGVYDPQTMRTVVTGLALQTISKKYGVGDGLGENAYPLLTPAQRLELVAERDINFDLYKKMALDIYENITFAELDEALSEYKSSLQTATSTPDATGNDLTTSGSYCSSCGVVHE